MIGDTILAVCDTAADAAITGFGKDYLLHQPTCREMLKLQTVWGALAAAAAGYKLCRFWWTRDITTLYPGRGLNHLVGGYDGNVGAVYAKTLQTG